VEEVAAADIGVAGTILHNRKVVEFLTCDELDPSPWARGLLREFAEDETGIAAGAISEPDAGTDNLLPYNEPDGGHRTSAVRDGDDYVLNGVKRFISEGGAATLYFVYARTDPAVGLLDGTSVFIVPRDTPGLTISEVHDKIGGRLSLNSELTLHDVRVPADHRLGPLHHGLRLIREKVPAFEYVINTARCIGLARACYEASLAHARTRVQGGRPIVGHDLVAEKLVEMDLAVETARSAMYRAAWAADHRTEGTDHIRLGRLAFLYAQRAVVAVATQAQEIHGAYGIVRGGLVEKLVRDAHTALSFEGGQIPKRLQLGRALRV
jgi:alkylation response protein AidB-like acyl-CoA dehydrogenase